MEGFHALLILMVVIWIAGKVSRSLGMPVLVGELIGGIIVGPIGLGLVAADSEIIHVLAELGIFFLMLHAGLESDPRALLGMGKKAAIIAISSIILPLLAVFGVAKGFGIATGEAVFMSVALSITAIAISIRVLKDCGIGKTKVAQLAIGAAVINDILALVLFSVILSVFQTGSIQIGELSIMVLKLIAFLGVVMFAGFRYQKYFNRWLNSKGFTLTLIIALALGLLAESIGLHIIIGSFLAGLFIKESEIKEDSYRKIEDRIYGLSYSFLGPIFFTSLAFNLDLSVMAKFPLLILALLAAMFISKVIGSGLPAYYLKETKIQSLILGVTMNGRGAVDLVVAAIGLQMGIIGTDVFSIIVTLTILSIIVTIISLRPLAKWAE